MNDSGHDSNGDGDAGWGQKLTEGPTGDQRAPRCAEQGISRTAWLVATAAILALTAYLMRGWLFGGGLPTSARRETLAELTMVWMAREDLAHGQLFTEWNRYWFAGFPWLRYLSYPLYYAVAAVSAWGGVSLETAMVGFFVLVLAGSALAMFGYLSHLSRDWRPALLGAVVYEAFPFHNHVGVETWIHAAFWALPPLALWFIELSRAPVVGPGDPRSEWGRRASFLLLTGIVLGLFPVMSSEYTLLVGPFVAVYLILRDWADVRQGRRTWPQAIRGWALAAAVTVGTSAFFVLPGVLETGYVGIHAKHGGGTTFTNTLISDYAVTPRLVSYAVARRWGLAADSRGLPAILGSFWSTAWYPGIVAPVLGLVGLFAARRHFASRYALIALLLAMLMVTGPTNRLNPFTYVPVLGRLSPFRGALLAVLFGAILVACGWAWLQRRCETLRIGKMPLCGLLLAAALLGVVIDFGPSAGAYQSTDAYFTPAEQEAYAWLKEHAPEERQMRLWEVATLPRDQYLRTYSLSQAPMMRFSGYYDNGAPLYAWQQGAWTDLRTRLRLQQVRYVLVRDADPDMDELGEELRLFGYHVAFTTSGVEIWENPDVDDYARLHATVALDASQDLHSPFQALPEFVWRNIAMVNPPTKPAGYDAAELGGYAYILADEPAAREALGLDLAPEIQNALLEKIVTPAQVGQLAVAPQMMGDEKSITLRHWHHGRIGLSVRAAQRGVLVLSESWYPHWRVWVDGQPQAVLRADWASLGVWIEPGEHEVEFRFVRPWYVYLGMFISAVTWLALATWWIRTVVNRIKRSSRPVV